MFQQLRTLNGLVKSRTFGSRTNSESYNDNFYPLNDLPVISARYVVGRTQYPVAVVMATPCTVLTETRYSHSCPMQRLPH